jgi:hypothetical protein
VVAPVQDDKSGLPIIVPIAIVVVIVLALVFILQEYGKRKANVDAGGPSSEV